MKSEGPPDKRIRRTDLTTFVEEVIDLDGEWVEVPMLRPGKSSDINETYTYIGKHFAEVRQSKGIMYGRMKEGN